MPCPEAAEDARADIESHLDNVANAAKNAGDKAVSEAGADINAAVNDGRQQAGESVRCRGPVLFCNSSKCSSLKHASNVCIRSSDEKQRSKGDLLRWRVWIGK